jgi:hypothetical protein
VGVLLKPTPDMGYWAVEMFIDRTCLLRTAPVDSAGAAHTGRPVAPARDDVVLPELDVEDALSGRGFGFEIADLEPVIAALDQVLDDALYCDYIGRVNVDLGRWRRPQVEDGWVRIGGPVIDATIRARDRAVELSYVHVAELRLMLVDFADARAAGDAS